MHFLSFSLLLCACVVAFAAGYVAAVRRHGVRPFGSEVPPSLLPPSTPVPLADGLEPTRVVFDGDATEGSHEWRRAMQEVGAQMRQAGVRLVVFAHGSFVGDDPLAIAHVLDQIFPLAPELGRGLRGFTRAQLSRVLGDLSNFPRDYVEAFARATGLAATDFAWSGENHHAARIQGAVRLARTLALHGGGNLRPGDRALLVGHSHGGQLFALLSQLVARAPGYDELVAAAEARGEDTGALEEHVDLLRRCAVDVVTYGTPPRYRWAHAAGFRVLHLVNHRGGDADAAEHRRPLGLLGALHTKHGDYVHRLGGDGSDFPAPTALDRQTNSRLDALLGEGTSLRAWLASLGRGRRVATEGRTVMVDYGDDAALVPNFLASGLGHAAYTRREAMLFHARLVARELYPAAPRPAWGERLRGWFVSRTARNSGAPRLPPAPRS